MQCLKQAAFLQEGNAARAPLKRGQEGATLAALCAAKQNVPAPADQAQRSDMAV